MNLVKEVVSDAAEFGKEMLGGGKSNKFVPPSPAEKGSNDEEEDIEMPSGDYRIQIHILEARDLIPTSGIGTSLFSNKEGSADPLVELSILGETQCTKHAKNTLSPMFNETLYFHFQNQSAEDLENAEILLNVMDHNSLAKNTKLGSFLIDLPFIYAMKDHDAYRKWAPLSDFSGEPTILKGYVKLSINILGPQDKLITHRGKELKETDIKDNMLTPEVINQGTQRIVFNLYRASNLPIMDSWQQSVTAYTKLVFAGGMVQSSVTDGCNPIFAESLSLKYKTPAMRKKLTVELWDSDLVNDERIGSFNIKLADIPEQPHHPPPKWANLYGAPLDGEGEYATYMNKYGGRGSTYRGSIYYSIRREKAVQNSKEVKRGSVSKIEDKPPSEREERIYTLRAGLYEGHELPKRESLVVQISCGTHTITSKDIHPKLKNSFAQWNKNMKDLHLPKMPRDLAQIPDIFIYLAEDEERQSRICYKRIKAKDIFPKEYKEEEREREDLEEIRGSIGRDIEEERKSSVERITEGNKVGENIINKYELVEDKSLDRLTDEEFPGFLFIKLELLPSKKAGKPQKLILGAKDKRIPYNLRINLYNGRDFPQADACGCADPFIIFRCAGEVCKSSKKMMTLNPSWFETLEMDMEIPEMNEGLIKQEITALVYDWDEDGCELMGIATIPIQGLPSTYNSKNGEIKIDIDSPPISYDVIYPGGNEKQGRITVGYQLIKEDESYDTRDINFKDLHSDSIIGQLRIGSIGLRNAISSLNMFPLRSVYFVFEIDNRISEGVTQTKKRRVRDHSCNILEMSNIKFNIPFNPIFAPVLTVFFYDNYLGAFGKRCLGISVFPLGNLISRLLLKKSTPFPQLNNEEGSKYAESECSINLDIINERISMAQDPREEIKYEESECSINLEEINERFTELPREGEGRIKEAIQKAVANIREITFIRHGTQTSTNFNDQSEIKHVVPITSIPDVILKQFKGGLDLLAKKTSYTQERAQGERGLEAEKHGRIGDGGQQPKEKLITGQIIDEERVEEDSEEDLEEDSEDSEEDEDEDEKHKQIAEPKVSIIKSENAARELIETFSANFLLKFPPEKPCKMEIDTEEDEEEREPLKGIKVAARFSSGQGDVGRLAMGETGKKEIENLVAVGESEFRVGVDIYHDEEVDEENPLLGHPKWFEGKQISELDRSILSSCSGVPDTIVGEEYDKQPEYMRGRLQLNHQYKLNTKNLQFYELIFQKGQKRGGGSSEPSITRTGKLKSMIKVDLIGSESDPQKFLQTLVPTKVIIRVYILEGISLTPMDSDGFSDAYIALQLGKKRTEFKKESLQEKTNNPRFYFKDQLTATFPGEGVLKIEIMDHDGFGGDDLIGSTSIDLENRYYSKEWQSMKIKPIEIRDIYTPSTKTAQGAISMWVDIFTVKEAKVNIPFNITPPPIKEFEVRVIIWGAKNVIFKDTVEKCSDLFIQGTLGDKVVETDTHWRCRGVASFNYRWKFQIKLPLHGEEDYGKDILKISQWDRDIVKSNEMISETSLSLNTHKMLKKTYYRDEEVKMKRMDPERGATDRFWLTCYHPEVKEKDGITPKPQVIYIQRIYNKYNLGGSRAIN